MHEILSELSVRTLFLPLFRFRCVFVYRTLQLLFIYFPEITIYTSEDIVKEPFVHTLPNQPDTKVCQNPSM